MTKSVDFRVANSQASLRESRPVYIKSIGFEKDGAGSGSFVVVSSDFNTRVCHLNRLPSRKAAQALFDALKKAKQKGTAVSFQSAGGFSPNRWFCAIKEVDALTEKDMESFLNSADFDFVRESDF